MALSYNRTFNSNKIVCHLKILFVIDTLDSSYAMVLLPLACEPLEYIRGKFTSEEKQQDRVC